MSAVKHQPATPLPTIEQIHAFLAARYKHDRFEGRNGQVWGHNYSTIVAQSTLDYLRLYGKGLIGKYESRTGEVVRFDASLRDLGESS